MPHVNLTTFSIVARCPQTGDLGVAVSTAIPAVGEFVVARPFDFVQGDVPDPADLPFLEVAAQASAVLVTGNRRHFPEAVCGPVQVLSPAEFLVWWQEHAAER